MKSLGIPAVSFNKKSNKNITNPVTYSQNIYSTPLKADTVSFKAKEKETICDDFGLLRAANCEDEDFNINDHFNATTKYNSDEKVVLDKFSLNLIQKNIGFYGDERDLARALKTKQEPAEDFSAASDDKYNLISYVKDGVKYSLRYDKKSHELVKGVAVVKDEESKTQQEFGYVKIARTQSGEYFSNYKLMMDSKGETAIEDSYIIFDKDIKVKTSTTNKEFRYSDGARESQTIERQYDAENGSIVSEEISNTSESDD